MALLPYVADGLRSAGAAATATAMRPRPLMEVVLRQDVDKLGLRGEVVQVARGCARNLLPRGLAEPRRQASFRSWRSARASARHQAKTSDEAGAIATRLEAIELRFDVNAGPTGRSSGR
jgi:large subunit ribosomal protein L9